MQEIVKFKLDFSGAKMENLAFISCVFNCINLNEKKPRYFYLDKPFYLIMKQKDS